MTSACHQRIDFGNPNSTILVHCDVCGSTQNRTPIECLGVIGVVKACQLIVNNRIDVPCLVTYMLEEPDSGGGIDN